MNPILILIICIGGILLWALYALVLQIINKIFRLQELTFRQSLLIIFLFSLIVGILGEIGTAVKMSGIVSSLGYLVGSVASYFLYKKYVSVSVGKFIALWIAYNILSFVITILLIVGIRLFVAQPFIVSGDSMAPSYPDGTYLIIEEWDKSVQKGDVVIEKAAKGYFIIARVVGIPGDIVADTIVPSGEYYLSKDSESATEIPGLVSQGAIVGKPILNLGKTSF